MDFEKDCDCYCFTALQTRNHRMSGYLKRWSTTAAAEDLVLHLLPAEALSSRTRSETISSFSLFCVDFLLQRR